MFRRTLILVGVAGATACGGTEPPGEPSAKSEKAGRLVVTAQAGLRACPACPEWTPVPGVSYRTPDRIHTGVLKVELLRSAQDLQPHALVERATPEDVDLIAGATFANVAIDSIPPAIYSHMRVTLAYTAYAVPARAHASATAAADGQLELTYALSRYTDAILGARQQGDFVATWTSPVAPSTWQRGRHPLTYPPAYTGATVETGGALYRVTFPLPGGPLAMDGAQVASVEARVTYYVEDSFGWVDVDAPGNSPGVLDLSVDPASTETPASLEVRGFSIEAL